MKRCERLVRRALLKVERGEDPGEHVNSCHECQAELAQYERLRTLLQQQNEDSLAQPGWQQGVWRRIDALDAVESGLSVPWGGWVSVGLGAVGLSVAALVVALLPADPPVTTLDWSVTSGPVIRRGGAAQRGDTIRFEATVASERFVEFRLYRNEREVVLRCRGEAPCTRAGLRFEAPFTVDAEGTYQAVLVVADSPFEQTLSGFDVDTASAQKRSAEVLFEEFKIW